MSKFRPTRASPPFKPTRHLEHALPADVSRSSTNASVPELTGLLPEDIDLLDAVIDRAGPSATTFLSVFKAYNDVLRDRGLDPQEVVYYGKLLKLGTMKGKNWGDKWDAVKAQHTRANELSNHNRDSRQFHLTNHVLGRGAQFRVPPAPTEDTLRTPTPSHTADLDAPSSSSGISNSIKSKRQSRIQTTALDSSDDWRRNSLLLLPDMPPAKQHKPWRFEPYVPSDSEECYAPSTTRLAATRRPHHFIQESLDPKPLVPAVIPPATARQVIASARERKGSAINEDDAWNKIKRERDEAEAETFRKIRLLERCWKVWTQLYQWIVTTNVQVAEARDNLITRIYLQQWRKVTSSRQDLYQRISIFSDNRFRKKFLTIWRRRLRGREQDKWRQDMRKKLKTIREKRELKLCKDAWGKWRQLYRSHMFGRHYTERLVHRLYACWKKRLSAINQLELVADNALQISEEGTVLRFWDRWRTARHFHSSERMVSERIDWRLMRGAMSVWQKNMSDHRLAMEFYQRILVESSIRSWKAAQDRIYTMENRALKHIARQDDLLVRAIFRVWKARRQGKTVERLKASNLIYAAWSVWKQRLQQQSHNHNLASAILVWRMKLREKLKMARLAKMAVNFFATRRAWKTWHDAMNQRATERRLVELDERRIRKVFHSWLLRARRVKQRRLAEKLIQDTIEKQIKLRALTTWTNHVIAIRLRELDVAQGYNVTLLMLMFKKWQKVYAHRLEVLSLLQSYLLVKREDNMRRVFTRWLGLSRINRHRRTTLKEKEDEIKISVVACFWDKWRDRFNAEKLRPIERTVTTRTEKNTLFRAFGLWHSKTKSLPAIRLHASNTKAKYFEMWRQAMPRALQATKAREKDRSTTLKKSLDRWVQIHRTKMALKAVARARYLRLPTAAPRQTRSSQVSSFGPSHDILRNDTTSKEPASPSKPNPLSTVSLLKPRPFSQRSPGLERSSSTRESSTASRAAFSEKASSPTRTEPANDGTRSRLWQELREMQRKSRPSSLHSRSRG
ncbi:hypothetical protein C0992_001854 [Termitomyces sp. T32_za158]|nr:hypothetical protein C0992_001854 [Termitomyces sp. T32_za158]